MKTYKGKPRADLSKVDWARIDGTTDEEIERQIADDPDTAPIATDEDFARGRWVWPEPKTLVSLRVDTDVLKGFRDSGAGYQTKINEVLRGYAVKQGWIPRSAARATRGRGRPKRTG